MEKLNALRKQKIRAVILLEAVVALAIFASIATLLLGQIQKNRQEEAKILQKEEVLRVAKMALQTGQNQVNINGVEIQVFSSEKGLEVYHGSEQLLATQRAIRSRLLPCYELPDCPSLSSVEAYSSFKL